MQHFTSESDSTQEQKQHGLSVDSQIKALTDYCKQNNLKIYKIYNDAGISARKKYTYRPALLELLEDCKQKKIDLILFTKLDRWFRSVSNYYEVQSVLDEAKTPWRAIWEDYETETSSGQFKVNIMLSIAQAESDRTSERIKAVNQYRKEKGCYVGSAPTGYKVVGSDLIKDENKKEGMEAFFKEFLTSFSMTKSLKAASEHGVYFSDNGHMYRLINSPAYHGDAYGYKCEPYITKNEHKLILDAIKSRARTPKRSDRVYLFSGILFCGYCQKRMAGHGVTRTHADGSKIIHKVYECQRSNRTVSHPHLHVTETLIETYLINELDKILANYRISVSIQAKSKDRNKILKQKTTLESKLKRLTELYVDGDITKEDYSVKKENLQQQIDSLKLEPLPEPKELPDHWQDIYKSLDDEHKQAFWKSTIEKIIVTNETKNAPEIVFRS